MICGTHKKEMRQNSKGWFCATPVEKDGDKVVKWCQWKPSKEELKETREKVGDTDWDEIARGKIRSLFIQAHIQRNGIVPLSGADLITLDSLVETAMGNK